MIRTHLQWDRYTSSCIMFNNMNFKVKPLPCG